jgi:hypothetical protein
MNNKESNILKVITCIILVALKMLGIHSIRYVSTELGTMILFTAVMLNFLVTAIIIVDGLYNLYIRVSKKIKYDWLDFICTAIFASSITFSIIAMTYFINDQFYI